MPVRRQYVHPDEKAARLRQVERSQLWLWVAECGVAALGIVAFVLLSFPAFREHLDPVYRVEPSHAMPALAALLLLFGSHSVYRQWLLRQEQRALTHPETGAVPERAAAEEAAAAVDEVSGLVNRRAAEEWLKKEFARGRRTSFTLLMLRLNEFRALYRRGGNELCAAALREAADRIKEATRGSDLAAHLGDGEFAVALSGCALGATQPVLARLGAVQVRHGTYRTSLDFSSATVDYQAGEAPAEFIERGRQLLKLYETAGAQSDAPVSLSLSS
ncbi:MAG: diguanylate cyclase domain-containing protein [Candidatus Acidiferrales bacterium]